ncbi:hypothetical protein PYK79_34525, partial [Streptomyces sp. ID05-04B]|nr:hypothetical protein [Streptomyces sp. ID05-04B]
GRGRGGRGPSCDAAGCAPSSGERRLRASPVNSALAGDVSTHRAAASYSARPSPVRRPPPEQ